MFNCKTIKDLDYIFMFNCRTIKDFNLNVSHLDFHVIKFN